MNVVIRRRSAVKISGDSLQTLIERALLARTDSDTSMKALGSFAATVLMPMRSIVRFVLWNRRVRFSQPAPFYVKSCALRLGDKGGGFSLRNFAGSTSSIGGIPSR